MEVKVSVDGVQRVVCGVTGETTCQEVVIALAQALGQPGRYTLREKFKEFERSMTPGERLLESLDKYGQQARDVQLTLLHNGPSLCDAVGKTTGGRYQTCPIRRRKDAGTRARGGSATLSLQRRSLPPLSSSQEAEPPVEEAKKQKRKSLTLMEEAWGWLESLGKGKVYNTASDKEGRKKKDRKNSNAIDVSVCVEKATSAPAHFMSKVRGQKAFKSDLDHQTTCCTGNPRGKEGKGSKKTQRSDTADLSKSKCAVTEDEVEKSILRETIMLQLTCLQHLQVHTTCTDKQILELEQQQRAREMEQDAERKMTEEEVEQIELWENELKAEEDYENDLQCQFLAVRERVADCKAKLEEYKCKMQRLDFSRLQNQERSNPDVNVKMNRDFLPKQPPSLSPAPVPPSQSTGPGSTGPTEPRESWAQNSTADTKGKVIHRSELTIYLRNNV